MIDHFEIKVRNLQISKDFYTSFLSPLGYKLALEVVLYSVLLLPTAHILVEIFGWGRESSLRFTLLFWQKTMSGSSLL